MKTAQLIDIKLPKSPVPAWVCLILETLRKIIQKSSKKGRIDWMFKAKRANVSSINN